MKNRIYGWLLVGLAGLMFATQVYGQTASPSAIPSDSMNDAAIEKLKEKVANKVTEIRRNNNKAVAGTVIKKTSGTINIKTNEEMDYVVKLDDALTKYFRIQGTKKTEIKANEIELDEYIIVTGVATDKTITANTIFVDERFLVLSGKISQVDKESFTLKIITSAKEEIDLDIENSTKQSILNIKTHETEASGFSKIKEGDAIHFVVSRPLSSKEANYSAKKILIIPQEYFIK